MGPGTGAVTDSIVEAMGPADRLDIVEVIPAFVQHLRARIEAEGRFSKTRDRVRVFRDSVEGFSSEQPYDLIVSSLPLNNFTAAEVELILATFARLAPGGLVSFFEYLAIRRLRGLVSGPAGRTRLRGVGAALGGVIEAAEVDCARVWTNIPPAVVHVLDVSLWPRAVETPKIEAES